MLVPIKYAEIVIKAVAKTPVFWGSDSWKWPGHLCHTLETLENHFAIHMNGDISDKIFTSILLVFIIKIITYDHVIQHQNPEVAY